MISILDAYTFDAAVFFICSKYLLITIIHAITMYNMKPVDNIVLIGALIGHNSFVFDTLRLLRNGGCESSNQLQEIKVLFTDSLPVIKFTRSQPNNVLKSSPNSKQGHPTNHFVKISVRM